MSDPAAAIEELRERLRRYPADRYPVQHATARFQLGVAWLAAGRPEQAAEALETAIRMLESLELPVERAKATNMLGVARRGQGRPGEARAMFRDAAAAFDSERQQLECGAALFNLGLVEREQGEQEEAARRLAQARELLDPARVPSQASAAAREHGAALLELGQLDRAAEALGEALELAERAGDAAALGAAANMLGLAELSRGRADEAIALLSRSAANHPRALRPADYAMAKANLALAYESAADTQRAALAVRQALGVPEPPPPVRDQAAALLARLPPDAGHVLAVLDLEPAEQWPALIREELARWADAPVNERRETAAAWIEGQLARPRRAPALAEQLLGGLLELPPPRLEVIVRSLLEALAERDPESARRFRSETSRAMAAFQLPQESRLRQLFDSIAAELGQEREWS